MLLALAAVLVAAPTSLPLDGCVARAIDYGWMYACGELAGMVQDVAVRGPADQALGAVADARRGQGATVTRERKNLGGTTVELIRIEDPFAPAPVRFSAALQRAEGIRVLTCYGRNAQERCGPILELLATDGWQEGPLGGATEIAGDPVLTLAGREVAVPAGCHAERKPDRQVLICDAGSFLYWSPFVALSQAEAMLKTFVDARAGELGARPVDFACRVGGVAATCRRFSVRREDGKVRTYASGAVQIGSASIFASCVVEGEALAVEPCTRVFEFPPE